MKRTLSPVLLAFLSAAVLFSAPVQAALPDPVAFGVAMELGNTDKAEQWMNEGLSPNFEADRIGTGLMIGAWEGKIPLMEVFLRHGADVNFTNRRGEQALQLAAWKGQLEAVKWLLAHGAAVNRQGNEWSALHYAVFAGHKEVAQWLMGQGANVNGKAPNGSTVLMMAAREGHDDLAKALLEAGADPSPRNEWGDNALTWAMRQGNLKIAKMVGGDNFALAAKIPPQAYGQAIRSVPPPANISEILRQIRLAEAEGRPTTELRAQFHAAVDEFKRPPSPAAKVVQPKVPKAASGLVITADRKGGSGERAEMNYAQANGGKAAPAKSSGPDPVEILHQITEAAAQGKNTDALRKQFYDAVKTYKAN